MKAVNPAFIPRNHLVEEAIARGGRATSSRSSDCSRCSRGRSTTSRAAEYALPPRPEEVVRETFCGT